jgi:hypothetical protein
MTFTAADAAAGPAASDSLRAHPWLPAVSIRLSGGLAIPSGDLASEERVGFAGGQGAGFTVGAGARVLVTSTLAIRPELSYYRFGRWRADDLTVLIGTTVTTGDLDRRTQMGGLRVYLEYVPAPEGGFSVFLSGGLGLVYTRYDDRLVVVSGDTFEHHEGVVSGSAAGGVGIMLHHIEVMISGSLQEPGFEDFAPTWNTFDLSVAYWLPSPF